MVNQNTTDVDLKALEDAKKEALKKVNEIDSLISQVKQQMVNNSDIKQSIPSPTVEEEDKNLNLEKSSLDTSVSSLKHEEKNETNMSYSTPTETTEPVGDVKSEDEIKQKESVEKTATVNKKLSKKEQREQEKLEKTRNAKKKEKQQLDALAKSISNRTKGKVKADPGNSKMKYTNSEVFIFLVDDNELQLKVIQEHFKNSRSFKQTKGFMSGEALFKYLKTRRFPKNSIFIVVMDYFLEKSDDAEAQNGIEVLNQIKEYDPAIEVIMLSSSSDVDIATSATHFGAVTFIQKGNDAMKKVFNNIVWIIKEKNKLQQKAATKAFTKTLLLVFGIIILLFASIDTMLKGKLGFAVWAKEDIVIETTAPQPQVNDEALEVEAK